MLPVWPAEWEVVRTIRQHGDVAVLAAAGDRVILCASKVRHGHDITAIAAAHRAVDSPLVPALLEEGTAGELAFVVLACDARADLATLLQDLSAASETVRYGEGVAFNEFLMDSVEAVHEAHGPIGMLAWSSFWVGPSGRLWLAGLGADLLARGPSRVEAPEIRLGIPATEASDVFVVHTLVRNLLPYVEMLPLFENAMKGLDARMYAALHAMSTVLSPDHTLRPPSIAALRARYRAMRAMAPTAIPESEEAQLAHTLARIAQRVTGSSVRLVIDETAYRVRLPDGVVLDLSRRVAPWRILGALVLARRERPGGGVSMEALQCAGWPDEALVGTSGRARVYVAVSTLRKLGLASWIVGHDGGYLLSAHVEVERARVAAR